MTKLDTNKSVRRETATLYRGRALVVTLNPKYLEIAEKGRREPMLVVPYDALFEYAHKLKYARERGAA